MVVQRPSRELRRTLIGREYAVTRPDGTREAHEVSPQELPDLLATAFGITLSAADARALVAFHER
ncbi:hypothetical protein OJ254_07320 [Streptomyces endophytica]|uniref:Uncharacterized protein n=1 Tax=Streptomyces endophytica TaxID=2991496 RepID=A0ABY6P9T8_9ACTN|nr:hypothetical protein [Streptomyces endophytica]UZJ30245.1 hypothetical protein OJ254_07320 [Streptomyces endophytica]